MLTLKTVDFAWGFIFTVSLSLALSLSATSFQNLGLRKKIVSMESEISSLSMKTSDRWSLHMQEEYHKQLISYVSGESTNQPTPIDIKRKAKQRLP